MNIDNFYNIYSLSARLLGNLTYATETLRQDRKLVTTAVKEAK